MSGRQPLNGSKLKRRRTASMCAAQLMRTCNGCKFFAAKGAATELDQVGVVARAVIDMVTVGRAKSAVGNIALWAVLE
jgi:hypothetical protein